MAGALKGAPIIPLPLPGIFAGGLGAAQKAEGLTGGTGAYIN